MRVLFINPPWIVRGKHNIWRNIGSIMPSLGIAWLAAVLERDGHQVKILDAHAEQIPIESVTKWVYRNGPFDLVGITSSTPLIRNAINIARLLKSEFPYTQIVLGGVHPTVLPEDVLAEPSVDMVVRGEGEETIREIAAEKPWEDIDGISYRQDGLIIHNPERKLIADLDTLPFPAYHLLPMHKYRPAAGAYKRLPASSVLATRGCPGRCTFCYRIFGNRLRCRSGQNIAQEVRMLHDHYGIKEICFYDDTFTAVRREVQNFCHAIQEMGLDITWSCFSRIDTFDEEMFRLMKETGCHQVMYGVETYSQDVLKKINKKIDHEIVEVVIKTTKKIGLDVRAAFMLGNPGDTEETLKENINYAIRLDPDLAIFNITTPYPGTEMYNWAEENNYLITKNWEDYDLSVPVLKLPSISAEKIMEYYRKSHRRFFLRPQYIYKRVRKIHNIEDISSLIRGVRSIIG